jgi:two-component system chemotaxis response regulator CheB
VALDSFARVDGAHTSFARSILVIATSASALDATRTLLRSFPSDLRAAVIVVPQPGDSPTALAALLRGATCMRTKSLEDGDAVCDAAMYIAPSFRHVRISGARTFRLVDDGETPHTLSAVDSLLESAAAVFGPRVLAIVLTDRDRAGSAGPRAVTAAGGVVVAQRRLTTGVQLVKRTRVPAADRVLDLASMPALISAATQSWAVADRC